jgi:hypothetical protein
LDAASSGSRSSDKQVDSAKDQKTKFLYHLRFKTQRLPEIPLPCVGICAGGT